MKVREMRRRFTVKEYHRMVEAGILHEDGNVELIQGEVIEKHPPGKKRFTVEEYHGWRRLASFTRTTVWSS